MGNGDSALCMARGNVGHVTELIERACDGTLKENARAGRWDRTTYPIG
jgi:hypothetical protein